MSDYRRFSVLVWGVMCLAVGLTRGEDPPAPCTGSPTYRFKIQGSTDGSYWSDNTVWIYGYPNSSVNVSMRTLMTVASGADAGMVIWRRAHPVLGSVCLSCIADATTAGTQTATVKNGSPPDMNNTQIRSGFNAYTQGVTIDNNVVITLAPVTDFVTSKACYRITMPYYAGYYYLMLRFSHNSGNPRIRSVVTQQGQSYVPCANTYTFGIYVSSNVTPTQSSCSGSGSYAQNGGGPGGVNLAPRKPLAKEELALNTDHKQRLIVKFIDDVIARPLPDSTIAFFGSQTSLDTKNVSSIASKYGLAFSQLIDLPHDKIETLRDRAAIKSGDAQPDLAGIMIVQMKEETQDNLLAVGKELLELEEVEYAYFESLDAPPPSCPDPTDPLPCTLLYDVLQRYRGPNPGMDIDFALAHGNARGHGVRLTDCERNWLRTHEDLKDVSLPFESGQTPQASADSNHGTAVLGIIAAKENNYGCTGLSPDANVHLYLEINAQGQDRHVACITSAVADSAPGDVVLLEMQTAQLTPKEVEQAAWNAIKVGTDAGVIVIVPAGNGGLDLDSAAFATWRNRGDSGSIIVGAGGDNLNHDRLDVSCFGSKVHVQGWGQHIFTLGYGDAVQVNGPNDPTQWYTNFNGTSGASAMVAAGCASLQSHSMARLCRRLTRGEMRDLLLGSGISQGSAIAGHIGPFISMRGAVEQIDLMPSSYHPFRRGDFTGEGPWISQMRFPCLAFFLRRARRQVVWTRLMQMTMGRRTYPMSSSSCCSFSGPEPSLLVQVRLVAGSTQLPMMSLVLHIRVAKESARAES